MAEQVVDYISVLGNEFERLLFAVETTDEEELGRVGSYFVLVLRGVLKKRL
jgi:hypothetical protein